MKVQLVCAFERDNLLVLIVLKVAVREISIVIRRFFIVDCFLAKIFRLGFPGVPEEDFENKIR